MWGSEKKRKKKVSDFRDFEKKIGRNFLESDLTFSLDKLARVPSRQLLMLNILCLPPYEMKV
jgi:hypothetical protein